MKKFLSVILALAMLLSCVLVSVSCAKEEKPEPKDTKAKTESTTPAETGKPETKPAETKPAAPETKPASTEKPSDPANPGDPEAHYYSLLYLIDTDSIDSDNPVYTSPKHGEENAASLFDSNEESKWCLDFDPNNVPAITFKTVSPIKVMAYDFWTADDTGSYPGRNPSHFVLYGSNDDGKNWDTLIDDDLALEAFSYFPCEVVELEAPTAAYSMFRVEFTSIVEGSIMQLAEFTLYGEEV